MDREEEKKHLEKMEEGIQMALEAAHALGSSLLIKYNHSSSVKAPGIRARTECLAGRSPSAQPTSDEPAVARDSAVEFFKKRTEHDVAVFKSVMDGNTYSRVARHYSVKYNEPSRAVTRVMFVIQEELAKPEYNNAPYQPNARRVYNTHVHNLRRYKDFLYEVLDTMPKEKLITSMSRFYK